jgi:site-specific DNA-methyltransferase (cytosine-N4-specific)
MMAGQHAADAMDGVQLLTGEARQVLSALPDNYADCCITSPPYWQRDYGVPGQIGLEPTVEDYVDHLVAVFAQLRRVLTVTATVWLNLGDCYMGGANGPRTNPGGLIGRPNDVASPEGFGTKHGLAAKNLAGLPWRVALALQDRLGFTLRSDIIWWKTNGMPESVRDRPARKHEYLFLLTPSPRYFFDLDAIRRPYRGDRALSRRARRGGRRPHTIASTWPPRKHADLAAVPPGHRAQTINLASGTHGAVHGAVHDKGANPGTVWPIPTRPSHHRHYAAFPVDLPLRAIAAGCPLGGTVIDPFSGSGTTLLAARQLGHPAVGIDINPAYHELAKDRLMRHDTRRAEVTR